MTLATPTLTNTHPALRRCWHPVARSADVAGGPVRTLLLGEPWVLVRLGPGGAVQAFPDRCPHRLAPLSIGSLDVVGDAVAVLRCAYHGWCFDASGRCVELPALGPGATIPPRARLRPGHAVTERHGMVFLAPTAPAPGCAELPSVPEAEDPSYMAGDLPPMRTRAAAGFLADNFLDMAHFPFVHAATFGAADPVVPPLHVVRDGLSFVAENEHDFVNREDPGVAAGIRPLVQRRRVTYRVHAPFHLVLRLDFLGSGGTNVIGFFLQPETEDSTRVYSTIWRNDLDHDPARLADAVAFEVKVVQEDLALQDTFDVRGFPLDPTAEVHTRADRSTLELRRMLAELVNSPADRAPGEHAVLPGRGAGEPSTGSGPAVLHATPAHG